MAGKKAVILLGLLAASPMTIYGCWRLAIGSGMVSISAEQSSETTSATNSTPDDFDEPPANDPSALVGLDFDQNLLATLPPANSGAFLGGPTGTDADEETANAVPKAMQQNGVEVPTNGRPSPLFGAQSFTQQMLLFEEFGREPLNPVIPASLAFPEPTTGPAPEQDPDSVAASAPSGAALEAF